MNKSNKIFLAIIMILLVILIVMTVSYLKIRNTAKENFNQVLEISEENMKLNMRISELEEKNKINSITNISNRTMPNSNVAIGGNAVLQNMVPDKINDSIEMDKVKLEVDKNTITPESISIMIVNNNENELFYGEEFKIQKKINDNWKNLDYISNKLYWNSIALITKGKSQTIRKLDVEHYYGRLDNGIYRVIKPVFDGNGGEVEICSDEFEI